MHAGWTILVGGLACSCGCSNLLGLDDYRADSGQSTGAAGSGASGGASGGAAGAAGAAGKCESAYPQLVVDDAAVSYWRLGDAHGPAQNQVDEQYPAVYSGNPPPVPGAQGAIACDTAVQLESSCLDARGIHNFSGNEPFSIEVWFRLDTPLADAATLVQRVDGQGWDVSMNTDGSLRVRRRTISGETYAQSAPLAMAGADATYHHVVGTYDGVDLRLYIDGLPAVSPEASSEAMDGVGTQLLIGASADCTANFFVGYLDEVAIYEAALASEVVKAHYDAAMPR